jgi:hypothetical protein
MSLELIKGKTKLEQELIEGHSAAQTLFRLLGPKFTSYQQLKICHWSSRKGNQSWNKIQILN